MSSHTRIIIMLAVLGIAAAMCAFLPLRGSIMSGAAFLNEQSFYAEVPTGATQTVPATTASTTEVNLPVLVYHIVRPSYPSDDKAVRALAQTPEVFAAQMNHLSEAGYHVVTFSALENYFKSGAPLPAKPVIISFDDGWGDQFKYAFPILEKYHYAATFFIFTNPIGSRGFMTWDDLRTLVGAGMTIGSHSLSHPYLTRMTDPILLWNEIRGSKQILGKNLGITVNEFAYPFGQYNTTTTTLVEKAGYLSARGDFYTGKQFSNRLYLLSALNAPTTTALFARIFPAQ